MIKRLYVHNFRCLENFELALGDYRSALLIGRNGAGKTAVLSALSILQGIARGKNRVGEIVAPRDIAVGSAGAPMRLEIDVVLGGITYTYSIAFDFPSHFREVRVVEERLIAGNATIYTRKLLNVYVDRSDKDGAATLRLDWHLIALPIVQDPSASDRTVEFRRWLMNMLLFRPVPSLIRGESDEESLQPGIDVTNVGSWFSGIIASAPSAYSRVTEYLKEVMPDLSEITNPVTGTKTRQMIFHISKGRQDARFTLDELSDGQRCFVVFALTMAANAAYGPLFCFWDEPENFLAPDEIGQSVMALRRAFRDHGQLVIATHDPQAVERFSDENTFLLYRNSLLEPTLVRSISDLRESGRLTGSIAEALQRGDVHA